ncbi:MAG: prepilin-type N-terminal cleavage/methylation domain-containing protein [Gemmatimonadales bacterium]|nr:prepilin-type N-terminal cleavage/methylation domain-containing protein [Gemmatimonadales bacterium]
MSARRARGRRGFSLIELLISMVVVAAIVGSAVAALQSQRRTFAIGGQRFELVQNARYAAGSLEQVLRTTGSGTVPNQPMFVYGDTTVVAVHGNYVTNVQDGEAVYVNPDVPAGATLAMPADSEFTLPNSTFRWPRASFVLTNNLPSRAELLLFYFRPDSTTPDDPDDWMLLQQFNSQPPQMVARRIYQVPGRPFLEFFVRGLAPASRVDTNFVSSTTPGLLPIRHETATHGAAGDTAGSRSAAADSVRAIRMNLRVSNAQAGADRRTRDITAFVELRNNGLVQLRTCGAVPVFNGPITTTVNAPATPPGVTLTWPASPDEASGERDVQQYAIYRRLAAEPAFGPAIMAVPAALAANYTWADTRVLPNVPYVYAVSAADCTPTESPLISTGTVTPNP